MTLVVSSAEHAQLWEQNSVIAEPNLPIDDFETLDEAPIYLGQGYIRSMEPCPGVWLDILNFEYAQDVVIKVPIHDHLVQCSLFLSGLIHYEDVYPTLGGTRSYLSGSGISPGFTAKYARSQRLIGVNIHLQPELLRPFLQEGADHQIDLTSVLIRNNEWKTSFFPDITLAMQHVVHQILKTPLRGAARRFYLQAKVFELLALQLNAVSPEPTVSASLGGLKSDTVARIHHAKAILAERLENPPLLLELAQQVGVSDRTLRRGFQELFGTTVVGYLTQQRMHQAEALLREGNCTVAEVANRVGYAHLGHFAAAFKRHFGITPKDCLAGQLSVLG